MILTSELLHQLSGHPSGDGFTKRQVELLGYTWPPPKGWLSSWIGKEMSQERYEEIRAAYQKKGKGKKREPQPRGPDPMKTSHVPQILCPFCFEAQSDPSEITRADEDGEAVCGACSKTYEWHKHVSVSYTTFQPANKPGTGYWKWVPDREEKQP